MANKSDFVSIETKTKSETKTILVINGDKSPEHSAKLNFDNYNGVGNGEMDVSVESDVSAVPAAHVDDPSDTQCERSEAVIKISSPQPITKPSTPQSPEPHTDSPSSSADPSLLGSLKRSFGKGKKKDEEKRKTPKKLFSFNKKKNGVENGHDEPEEDDVTVPETALEVQDRPELDVQKHPPEATASHTLPGGIKPHQRVHPARQSFGAGIQESEQEIKIKYQSSCVFFTPEGNELEEPKHGLHTVSEEEPMKAETLPKKRPVFSFRSDEKKGLTLPWRRPHSTAEADVSEKPKKRRRPLSFSFGQKGKTKLDTPEVDIEAPVVQISGDLEAPEVGADLSLGAGIREPGIETATPEEPIHEIGSEFTRDEVNPDVVTESSCLHFKPEIDIHDLDANTPRIDVKTDVEMPDVGGQFVPETDPNDEAELGTVVVDVPSVTLSDIPPLFQGDFDVGPHATDANLTDSDPTVKVSTDTAALESQLDKPVVTVENAPPLFVEPDMQARLDSPELDVSTNMEVVIPKVDVHVDIPKPKKKKGILGKLSFRKEKPPVEVGGTERTEEDVKLSSPTIEVDITRRFLQKEELNTPASSDISNVKIESDDPRALADIHSPELDVEVPNADVKTTTDMPSFTTDEVPALFVEEDTSNEKKKRKQKKKKGKGFLDKLSFRKEKPVLKVEVTAPAVDVNVDVPEQDIDVEMRTPEVDVESPKVDTTISVFGQLPSTEISVTENVPALFLSEQDVPETYIESSDVEMSEPAIDVSVPGMDISDSNFPSGETDVDLSASVKADVPHPVLKADIKLETPDVHPHADIPSISTTANVPALYLDNDDNDDQKKKKMKDGIFGSFGKPKANVNLVGPEVNLETSQVPAVEVDGSVEIPSAHGAAEIPEASADFDFSLPAASVAVEVPELITNADVKVPEISGEIHASVPDTHVSRPEVQVPGANYELNISGELDTETPQVTLPDVDLGIEATANLPALFVDVDVNDKKKKKKKKKGILSKFSIHKDKPKIQSPSLEVKSPNVQVNVPDIDVHVETPGVSTGLSEPSADPLAVEIEAPSSLDVDIQLPALDVTNVAPEADIDIGIGAAAEISGVSNVPALFIDEEKPTPKKKKKGFLGNLSFSKEKPNIHSKLDVEIKELKVDTDVPDVNLDVSVDSPDSANVGLGAKLPVVDTDTDIPQASSDFDFNIPKCEIGVDSDVSVPRVVVSLSPNLDELPKHDIPEVKPEGEVELSGTANVPAVFIDLDTPSKKKKNFLGKLSFKKEKPDLKTPQPDIDISAAVEIQIDKPKDDIEVQLPTFDSPQIDIDASFSGAAVKPATETTSNVPAVFVDDDKSGKKKKKKKKKKGGLFGSFSLKAEKPMVKLDIDTPTVTVDGETPNIEVATPEIDIHTADVDIKVDTPEIVGSADIDTDAMKAQMILDAPQMNVDFDHDLKKPEIDTNFDFDDKPELKMDLDVEKPMFEYDIPKPGDVFQVHAPDITVASVPAFDLDFHGDLDFDGPKLVGEVDVVKPNLEFDGAVKPEIEFEIEKPWVAADAPSLVIETPSLEISEPSVDIKWPTIDFEAKHTGPDPSVKIAEDIDLALPSAVVDVDDVIVGNVPALVLDADVKKPKKKHFGFKLPSFKTEKPKSKTKLSADLEVDAAAGVKADMPKVNIKAPELQLNTAGVPDSEVGVEAEVDAQLPSITIDIHSPEVDIDVGQSASASVDVPVATTTDNVPAIFVEPDVPKIKKKKKKDFLGKLSFRKEKPVLKIDTDVPEIDIKAPKLVIESPDIHLQAPNVDIDAEVQSPQIDLDFDSPSRDPQKLDLNIEMPKFNLDSGDSAIESSLEITAPKYDIESPKLDFDAKFDADAPEIEIDAEIPALEGPGMSSFVQIGEENATFDTDAPKIEVEVGNVPALFIDPDSPTQRKKALFGDLSIKSKKPEIEISGVDAPRLEVDAEIPECSADVDIDVPNVDIRLPKTENDFDVKVAVDADIGGVENVPALFIDGEKPKKKKKRSFLGKLSFHKEKPDLNAKLSTETPRVDIEAAGMDIQIPSAEVTGPQIDLDSSDLNAKATAFMDVPTIALTPATPNLNLNVDGARVQSETPKVAVGVTDIDTPTVETISNVPALFIDGEKPKKKKKKSFMDRISFKKEKPLIKGAIDVNVPSVDVDYGLPEPSGGTSKIDVDIEVPKINVLPPSIDIDVPSAIVDANIDMDAPNLAIATNAPSHEITIDTPRVIVDPVSLDVEIDVDLPKADIEIESPKTKFDTRKPEMDKPSFCISADEPDLNFSSDFTTPKLDNRVIVPEIDLSMPKSKIDIDVPEIEGQVEIDADISGPADIVSNVPALFIDLDADQESKMPSIGISGPKLDIDIGTPKLEIGDPEVNLDGEGAAVIIADAPKIEGGAGLDVSFPVPELEVTTANVPAIFVETKAVEGKVKKPKKKGLLGKLSFQKKKPVIAVDVDVVPAIDVNAPDLVIESPNIEADLDVTAAKIDIEIEPPHADAEVNVSGDIDVSPPSTGIEVTVDNVPAIFVDSKDVNVKKPKKKGLLGKLSFPKKDKPVVDVKVKGHLDAGLDLVGDSNLPASNINVPEITLDSPGIDVTTPKWDFGIGKAEVDLNIESPEIDAEGAKIEIDVPSFDIASPFVEVDSNVHCPSIDTDFSVERGTDADISLETPTIELPKVDIEVDGPKIEGEISAPGFPVVAVNSSISAPTVVLPEVVVSNVPAIFVDDEISKPKIDVPEIVVPVPHLEVTTDNVPAIFVDVNAPEIKPKTPKKAGFLSKFSFQKKKKPAIELKAEGGLDANLDVGDSNLTNIDINAPTISVASPNIEINTDEFDGEIPKVDSDVTINVSGPEIKTPKYDLDAEINLAGKTIAGGAGIDINASAQSPTITTENVPAIFIESQTPHVDVKMKKPKKKGLLGKLSFKKEKPMVELDLGPPTVEGKIIGPDVNVEMPKIEIKDDISGKGDLKGELPVSEIEITAPSITLDTPDAGAHIVLETPKIDIEQPSIQGSADLDLPTSNLVLTSNVPALFVEPESTVNLPAVSGDVSYDNVPAVFVDEELPVIDVKAKKTKKKKGKGKLSFNAAMVPTVEVKTPDLDSNLSTSVHLNTPEIDVNIQPEIDVKVKPEIDLDSENIDIDAPSFEITSPYVEIGAPSVGAGLSVHDDLDVGISLERPEVELPVVDIEIESPKIEGNISVPGSPDLTLDSCIDVPSVVLPEVEVSNVPAIFVDADVKVDKKKSKGLLGKFAHKKPKISVEANADHELSAEIDVSLPKIDVETSLADVEIDANVTSPSIDIDADASSLHTPEMKMPRSEPSFDIKALATVDAEIGDGGECDIALPDITGNVPALFVNEEKPQKKKKKSLLERLSFRKDKPKLNIDVDAPKAEIVVPDVSLEIHDISVDTHTDSPEIVAQVPQIDVESPKLQGDIDVNLSKPKIDIEIELPKLAHDVDIESSSGFPEADIGGSTKLPDVTIDNVPALFVDETPEKIKKKKKRSFLGKLSFSKEKPTIKVKASSPTIDVEVPNVQIRGPEIDIETPAIEIEPQEIDIESPFAAPSMPTTITELPSANFKADVDFPSVDVMAPTMDVHVSGPDTIIELPSGEIEADLPSVDVSGPKIVVPTLPSLDAGAPSLDAEPSRVELAAGGPDIDLSVDAGVTVPSALSDELVSSPEISAPGINVSLRDAELDIGGDVDYKAPALPSLDISGDVEGPKLEVETPDVVLDKPDLRVEIDTPKLEVKTPIAISVDADVKVKKPKKGFLEKLSFRKEKPKLKLAADVDLDIDAEAAVSSPDDTTTDNVSAIFIDEPAVKSKKTGWRPKLALNKQKPAVDFNVAAAGEISEPVVNLSGPEWEEPAAHVDLSIPKPDTPEVDVDINVPIPEVGGDVSVESPSMDITVPSAYVQTPAASADVDVIIVVQLPDTPAVNVEGDVSTPEVTVENVPAAYITEKKPKAKGFLDRLSFRKEKPEMGVEVNLDAEISSPEMKAEFKEPEVKLRKKDKQKRKSWLDRLSFRKEKPELHISAEAPGVAVSGPSLQVEVDHDIAMPSADVDLEAPCLTTDVEVPDVNVRPPSLDAGAFELTVESEPHTIEIPSVFYDANIPSSVVPSPARTIEMKAPTVKTPVIELPAAELDIKVQTPDIDGEILAEAPDASVDISVPDVSITLPSIEGGMEVSVDDKFDTAAKVNVSSEDIDITLPEVIIGDVPALYVDGKTKPKKKSWLDRISFRKEKPELDISTRADIDVQAPKVEVEVPRLEVEANVEFDRSVSSSEDMDAHVVIESPRIDADLDLPALPEIDVRIEDVPAQYIDDDQKPKRRSWLDRLSFRKEKPEALLEYNVETPAIAVDAEVPVIHIDVEAEPTKKPQVEIAEENIDVDIVPHVHPELELDTKLETKPEVEITIEDTPKIKDSKVVVKSKSRVRLPKIQFKKKEKKPKSPKKKGKKRKQKEDTSIEVKDNEPRFDDNVIDGDKPPLFIDDEITSADRDAISDLQSLAGSPSRQPGPQGTSTPYKVPLKAPRLQAPLSIDEISPSDDSDSDRKTDDERTKGATFRLYFANQSVREQDKTLPDTVVLPIVFDEYQTVYLYHPRDEESEWIEEKGMKKWIDHQKHRIYNILIKMKKRYDGHGLFLKFKYQDGLYGLQRTYYGDVHLISRGTSRVLSCCIFTETDIYNMELSMPPHNPGLNVLDGIFQREHIATGFRTYWEAAVHKHEAKRHFVQTVQQQKEDTPVMMES